MPASLRELRQRRASVATTMKITRAMELIAASRVTKAQQSATSVTPYTRELTRAVSAVATQSRTDHPLTARAETPTSAAMLLITSDRGLAGAYTANVIRAGESLISRLQEEGKQIHIYVSGRKGKDYFAFRNREVMGAWEGFSERPSYRNAQEMGDTLINAFLSDRVHHGVDEIYLVYTEYESMVTQYPQIVRLLPLEVVEEDAKAVEPGEIAPLYSFEPDADTVLDQILPLYVKDRVHNALLESAASELASRQQAMHSATDNAKQLIDRLTRDANQARQAEITQEINEIVGGAGALAEGTQEV